MRPSTEWRSLVAVADSTFCCSGPAYRALAPPVGQITALPAGGTIVLEIACRGCTLAGDTSHVLTRQWTRCRVDLIWVVDHGAGVQEGCVPIGRLRTMARKHQPDGPARSRSRRRLCAGHRQRCGLGRAPRTSAHRASSSQLTTSQRPRRTTLSSSRPSLIASRLS